MDNTKQSSAVSPQDIDQLISDLGLAALPDEQKKEVKKKIVDSVLRRTLERVAQGLTKEDMEEFAKLETSDATGNTSKFFIQTKVPNFDAILREELRLFKEDITGAPATATSTGQ